MTKRHAQKIIGSSAQAKDAPIHRGTFPFWSLSRRSLAQLVRHMEMESGGPRMPTYLHLVGVRQWRGPRRLNAPVLGQCILVVAFVHFSPRLKQMQVGKLNIV
jgi:hypothetical protein